MQNNFNNSTSPMAKMLVKEVEALSKVYKWFLTAILIIDAICFFVFVFRMGELIEDEKDIVMSFFGMTLDIEANGWLIFLFILVQSFVIGLATFVYLIFVKIINAKIESLNCQYRTMLFTEQMFEILRNSSIAKDNNANNEQEYANTNEDVTPTNIQHMWRCEKCNSLIGKYPCYKCGNNVEEKPKG